MKTRSKSRDPFGARRHALEMKLQSCHLGHPDSLPSSFFKGRQCMLQGTQPLSTMEPGRDDIILQRACSSLGGWIHSSRVEMVSVLFFLHPSLFSNPRYAPDIFLIRSNATTPTWSAARHGSKREGLVGG